jgi:hypothetical protein
MTTEDISIIDQEHDNNHREPFGSAAIASKVILDPMCSLETINDLNTSPQSLFVPKLEVNNVSSPNSSVIPLLKCLNVDAEACSVAQEMPFITGSVTRQ